MITAKALVLALAAGANAQVAPPNNQAVETFEGRVVRVKDGDTLGVMMSGREVSIRVANINAPPIEIGREVPIRISYIDAPEKKQDFGQVSKKTLSDLCYGTQAMIQVNSYDQRTQRYVATVNCRGQDVSSYMVANGLAWVYTEYARGQDVLKALEMEARRSRAGLWSQPNPVEPKMFRRAAKGQ